METRIKCCTFESGTYYGKLFKVEQTEHYKTKACQLRFSFSMIVGYKNTDENGEYYNYDCWGEKNYNEVTNDPIRQVAQQKEIISVVATILGMSEQRVTEELLPDVPFETACDFYKHVAKWVTNTIADLNPAKKRLEHPFIIRMENFKDRAYPKLGVDWIEACSWINVKKPSHEDILAQKTLYRVLEQIGEKQYKIADPVTIVAGAKVAEMSFPISELKTPSSKAKDGKEEVVLTVDTDDPFGKDVDLDDLPF